MLAHILVVEDSLTQAEAIRGILESAGYQIDVAATGEEALARFDARRYQAVISDVVMPGDVDGYELCRRIKNSPGGQDTPVVLLTSLASPMDIINGLASGADNFLTKPYDPVHLLERLQVLVRTPEARGRGRLYPGVDIVLMGRTFTITSDREQILDLLVSTFEDAVRQNEVLRKRDEELTAARAELARYAESLEVRLASVLRSVPDVLFTTSVELSALEYVSPAAASVTGYAPEEFMQDPGFLLRLVQPSDLAIVAVALKRAQAGEVVSEQFQIRHRDGATRWLLSTIVPVRDDKGHVERLDGIARDVTEARRLEDQLRQAQKMESVGRLAGGVAHDFNNLLSVILGWTEMALKQLPLDHAVRPSLEEVLKAGQGAATLTRQLLAFSRQQVVEPTLFDINDLVVEADHMLRRLIAEDIELVTRMDPELGTVKMDRGQLERVLMNLVVNARDAMPEGGELVIETANVMLGANYPRKSADAIPGRYVMLAVSDSGTGMNEETKSRLFEPFFTTKERDKGTGLGLATCYGIVNQAGGHIDVHSEEGAGTTMTVYLPLRDEPAAAMGRRGEQAPIGGEETILLVEDDAAVRRMTTCILEAQGYSVVSTSNAEEALHVIERGREPVQLLVTDVILGGRMNGPLVADRVRALRPELKVLFVTGYTSDVAVIHDMVDHGVGLVQKPFTANALGRKVREVLDAH